MYATRYASGTAVVLIILFLFIVRKNLDALLRDSSTQTNVTDRTYSLSKTLLFYWSMIIFLSLCYIGIVSDNIPQIDSGVLILMGIAAGTTTTAKAIDYTQCQNPPPGGRIQNEVTSGFLTDILSDATGISVSRLQTVLFNIIYGCVFVAIVVSQNVLYDFPATTLTLLGISSGAYALLKIPEN